jgi:hypothetical protein
MKNNSLERILRQKLEDLRIEPSSQARDLVYKKIRKRGRIILYRRLSIAAGITLICSAGFFYLRPADRQDVAVQEESSVSTPEEINEEFQPDTAVGELSENIPEAVTRDKPQTEPPVVNQVQENEHDPSLEEKQAGEITADPLDREPAVLANKKSGEMTDSGSFISESATQAAPAVLESLPAESNPLTETKSAELIPESSGQEAGVEPVKITIEYIASGSGRSREKTGQNSVREIYSKMSPEAVIGDFRTLKDQFFALEFINKRPGENQTER